jgi:peptide deformylase
MANPVIQGLIDDMLATLAHSGGIGLAAPQVSHPMRIIVVRSTPRPDWPEAPKIEPFVMINPRILQQSERTVVAYEGCLSIPGIRGEVTRPESVHVRYFNRIGNRIEEWFTSLAARVIQHEIDHLNGTLFIDYGISTLCTEGEYQRRIAMKYPPNKQ